jgi:acyl-CoA thioesterase-1
MNPIQLFSLPKPVGFIRLGIFFICAFTLAQAYTPEPGGEKVNDPAMAGVTDQPGLPRVMLIGDSISLGYTPLVRELLKGKANVHRPAANSGPTISGLKDLDTWLAVDTPPGQKPAKWDVIHFNFGLHDIKVMSGGLTAPVLQVPPDQYEKNLRELVKRLQATGAKLIWATTTPVPDSTTLRPLRLETDVVKYNEIAARVMADNKIPTDDLFNVVLPQEAQLQVKNNVHFTKPAYQLLAQHVADSIKAALAAP